jgi:hypothetical protein
MANGESDALDALEKEAKEYDKASLTPGNESVTLIVPSKDAEIDRILKAFRLDAQVIYIIHLPTLANTI